MSTKSISFFILLLTLFTTACQNRKDMKREKENLVHLLKEKENHNKYLFTDGYEPFVMTKKGYDYVDAHMVSSAFDNFFSFEEIAVAYRNRFSSMESREIVFRCLYINDKGQIAEVIKRKINISCSNLDSFDIDPEDIQPGTSRLYKEQFLAEADAFISDIIDTKEFHYFLIEKHEKDIDVYKIEVLNDDNRDLIFSNSGEGKYKEVYFYKALLIYDEKGTFLDVEIVDSKEKQKENIQEDFNSINNFFEKDDENLPRI